VQVVVPVSTVAEDAGKPDSLCLLQMTPAAEDRCRFVISPAVEQRSSRKSNAESRILKREL
jgi:hypothetical protein